MVYGRVIGNELRDVPPECLPIWGQRWSGYRTPHGPSSFSTRVFSVDQMSEVEPALTSPTQFDVALTEEDDAEDANSESSQFRNSFISSPLVIQADTAGLTSRPETLIPRSVHPSLHYLHHSPQSRRSPEHAFLQKSRYFGAALIARRKSEPSGTQDSASDPQWQSSPLPHGIPIHGGYGSHENGYALWAVDRTSTSTQPQADHSYPGQILDGQLGHTMPLHAISDSHLLPYPSQFNASLQPGSGSPLLPFHVDEQTLGSTISSSLSQCFTSSLSRLDDTNNLSQNHESCLARICAQLPYPLSPWLPPNLSSPDPLESSESPPSLEAFYHRGSNCDDFVTPSRTSRGVQFRCLTGLDPRGDPFTR